MKSLKEYILESESGSCKTFTFDFGGIENGEETVKSLEGKENYKIDGNKVTVTVCSEKEPDIEILQQAIESMREQSKHSSSEQYAQKTKALATKLSEMFEYIDSLAEQEEQQEGDKKEEE